MPNWRRAFPLACAFFIVAAVAIAPAGASTTAPSAQASKKAKGKKCGKGYKQVTVTKKGKKVKKCQKKGKKGPARVCKRAYGASASCAIPAPTTPSLFEAPGKVLEGEAAKPFLQKYLANSTFTDCPSGWGVSGCTVEHRYSHAADATFHYCRLTSSSGSDIRVTDEYGVEAAKVEPDGSWTFREVVYNSGNYSKYEWNVSTTGVVNGAYQFTPSSQIEKLGPYVYIGGVAKDCSY